MLAMELSACTISVMAITLISWLEGVSGEVEILPENGSGHCMLPKGFSEDCHVLNIGLMGLRSKGMLNMEPHFEGLVSDECSWCNRLSKGLTPSAPPLQLCASKILRTQQVQLINVWKWWAITSRTRGLGDIYQRSLSCLPSIKSFLLKKRHKSPISGHRDP